MSTAGDNKALVRSYVELAWNQAHVARLSHLVASEFVGHHPATRHTARGPVELGQLITSYRSAFSNLRVTVNDQVAEGNRVATRWTFHATHDGALQAIPATGRQVSLTGLSLHQVEAGRLWSEWTIFDALSIGGQIWAPAGGTPTSALSAATAARSPVG